MNKFKGVYVDELVNLYRKGDEDAKSELVRRFKISSKRIARIMFEQYPDLNLEFDELVSICIYSLAIALNNYNFDSGFYGYWKAISEHEMIKYIKDILMNLNFASHTDNSCFNDEEQLMEFSDSDCTANTVQLQMIFEEIESIFASPNYKFSETDKKVYLMVVKYGFSINEVSENLNIGYHTVRNKLVRTRNKLKNILFKTKI